MFFDIDTTSIIKSHNSFRASQPTSAYKTIISRCITISTVVIIEICYIVIHRLDL
jgi:hypothetical protein